MLCSLEEVIGENMNKPLHWERLCFATLKLGPVQTATAMAAAWEELLGEKCVLLK